VLRPVSKYFEIVGGFPVHRDLFDSALENHAGHPLEGVLESALSRLDRLQMLEQRIGVGDHRVYLPVGIMAWRLFSMSLGSPARELTGAEGCRRIGPRQSSERV